MEAVLCALEDNPTDESGFPVALKDLDRALAAAAERDMRTLFSAALSRTGGRKTAAAHGYRVRQVLTCFGWVPVRYAYVRKAGGSALLNALGVVARSTAAARDRVVRCAALCGSFAEGRDMLHRLTGMVVSITKLNAYPLLHAGWDGSPLHQGGPLLAEEISMVVGIGPVMLMSQYNVREEVRRLDAAFTFLPKPRDGSDVLG